MSKSLNRICEIQMILAKSIQTINTEDFLALCKEQADLLLAEEENLSKEIFIVLASEALELTTERLNKLMFEKVSSFEYMDHISPIHRRYTLIHRHLHQKKFGH